MLPNQTQIYSGFIQFYTPIMYTIRYGENIMKNIIALLLLAFITSNSIAYDEIDYYPNDDTYYRYMLMQQQYRNQSDYPGCDTCYLEILQSDSYTSRMLKNDMWRMETGHSYSEYNYHDRY